MSGSYAERCKIAKRLETQYTFLLSSSVCVLKTARELEGRPMCWQNGLVLHPQCNCRTPGNGTGTNIFDSPFVQGSVPPSILVAAFTLQQISTVSYDVGHISAKRSTGHLQCNTVFGELSFMTDVGIRSRFTRQDQQTTNSPLEFGERNLI